MRGWLSQGWRIVLGIVLSGLVVLSMAIVQPILTHMSQVNGVVQAAAPFVQVQRIQQIARSSTVRIFTSNASISDSRVDASGSGVIVQRQGQRYTVLTNWHVVGFSYRIRLMTADGRSYTPLLRRQLGSADLAIVQFRSATPYPATSISRGLPAVNDVVFSAGFPMYRDTTLATTFNQGIQGFRWTQGQISMVPTQPLARGYHLGYTNEVVAGMSGGPILNISGQLIGVNGRLRNADPAFGSYVFEDGTQPSSELLAQMVRVSWGIPIGTYLRFISSSTN